MLWPGMTPEHVVYPHLWMEFNPGEITTVLTALVPRRVVCMLSSPPAEDGTILGAVLSQEEEWFKVKYATESIGEERLVALEALLEGEPPACFRFPSKNPFIPDDFSLVPSPASSGRPPSKLPNLSEGAPGGESLVLGEAWYKHDNLFHAPKVYTFFRISSTGVACSAQALALTHLYVELVKDSLTEHCYMADLAGLYYSFKDVEDGLLLRVYGFSQNCKVLALHIAQVMRSLVVEPDRLAVAIEELRRGYRNRLLKPLKHARHLRLRMLCDDIHPPATLAAALEGVTPAMVEDHANTIFQEAFLESYLTGNITPEQAGSIAREVHTAFKVGGEPTPRRRPRHCAQVPEGTNVVVSAPGFNPEDENSGIEVYFQLGEATLATCAMADMLHQVMNEPCFDVLRTKQQLGYVVDCGTRCTCNIVGFCFVIQSAKLTAEIADQRIESFVQGFGAALREMGASKMEEHRAALVAEKLEKDDGLSDEAWRHWHEIADSRYCFNRNEKEADAIRDISFETLLAWFDAHFTPGAAARRRLAIHVQSSKPPTGESDPKLEAQAPEDKLAVETEGVGPWRKRAFECRNSWDIAAEYAA